MSNSFVGNLKGKVALVTGGSSGIGQAVVKLLLELEMNVVILDIVAPEFLAINSRYHRVDIRSSGAVSGIVSAVIKEWEKVDLLINSAGIVRPDSENGNIENLVEMLGVNVTGTYVMCDIVQRVMRPGSAIVNLGSITGFQGWKNRAGYCASKGAVHAMTKALALTYAEQGIRVNAVAPGLVDTPLIQAVISNAPNREDAYAFRSLQQANGRMLSPDEVARCIVYLGTPMSAPMTGAIVDLSVGRLAGHFPDKSSPGREYVLATKS